MEGARLEAEYLSAVRDHGLMDSDPQVRISIVEGDRGPLTSEQFETAMLDQNATVRRGAVEAMIGLPGSEVRDLFPQLGDALADSEPSVREAVVELLATIHHPKAIALLLQARGDSSRIVREEAAEALYRHRRRGKGPPQGG